MLKFCFILRGLPQLGYYQIGQPQGEREREREREVNKINKFKFTNYEQYFLKVTIYCSRLQIFFKNCNPGNAYFLWFDSLK